MRILIMCIALVSLVRFNWMTLLALVILIFLGKSVLGSSVYYKEGRRMRVKDLILLHFGRHAQYEVIFDNGIGIYRNMFISELLELSLALAFSLKVGQLQKQFLPYFLIPLTICFFKAWIPAVISTFNHYHEAKKGSSQLGIQALVLEKFENHTVSVCTESGNTSTVQIRAVDWGKIQTNSKVRFINQDMKKDLNTFEVYFNCL